MADQLNQELFGLIVSFNSKLVYLTHFDLEKINPARLALNKVKAVGTPRQVSEDGRKWLMCL